MIRTFLAAGALALSLGTVAGYATVTPAAAQDSVTIIRHHDGPDWRRDHWRDGPRWHRPPPRCRTVIRERMTRHGREVERTRICRR